jgi:hypothetical protein
VQILIGNSSVYFIFIAGFLFQFLSSKYTYKDYLKRKLSYVILPYLVVSIPAILLTVTGTYASPDWFNQQFSQLPIFGQIMMYLLTGTHLPSFWFIPMIAIFYIVSPILFHLDRNPKFYWLLPGLLVLTLLVSRPAFNNNPFQSFVHFLSVYVAGMFCCHFRDSFFSFMQKRFILFICAVVILIALQYWGQIGLTSINTLSKLILCALIIYFLWTVESQIPAKLNLFMDRLAELSFGIYFVHEYFVGYSFALDQIVGIQYSFSQANLLNFLLNFIFVLAASIATILIIKRIFGRNSRLIIGC